METVTQEEKRNFFIRYGHKIFLGFIFLLPVFFIPSEMVPFAFGKGFFYVFGVLLLAVLYLVGTLKEGSFSMPKSLTLLGLLGLLVATVVSAIGSADAGTSLLGTGFEIDTAFFLFCSAVLAFMVPMAFRNKASLFNVLTALLASFFVSALYTLIRLFFPGSLSFGVFTTNVANLTGSWNDLSIFAGFAVLIALISLGALQARGMWQWVLRGALVIGLILLAVVNFKLTWLVVAAFSLVFFLYSLSYAKHRGITGPITTRIKHVSWLPIVVLLVALIFIVDASVRKDQAGIATPGPIATFINSKTNATQIEVRPSWSATLTLAKKTLQSHPIVGVGPNQFVSAWVMNKPLEVNQSVFWSTDFVSGIGVIPTALITLGGLGLLAWLFFLGFFVRDGVRAIRRLHGDAFAHYLVFCSFASAVYFWIMAFIYTPTHVMYALAFLFTGVFVAAISFEGVIGTYHVTFADAPGKSFIGSLVIIVSLIALATGFYFIGKRLDAFVTFNNAIASYNKDGSLDNVQIGVTKALSLEENDLFYRTLSDIYLARLNGLLQVNPQNEAETKDLQDKFQQYLAGAVGSASAAKRIGSSNYLNTLSLARVYAAVVPLKIPGAYDQANTTYDAVYAMNPTSPQIYLEKARLEVATGNNEKALENLQKALQLKPNYTDAVFLMTQIEVQLGQTKKAITDVSNAVLLAPNDPQLQFELGLLYYNDGNYSKAIAALEMAVALQGNYANAKYFLGLSYDKVGRSADALRQFSDLALTNPDNNEVKFILNNLKAGKSAFSQVTPPLDNKPEKRKNPPVSEKSSKVVPAQ